MTTNTTPTWDNTIASFATWDDLITSFDPTKTIPAYPNTSNFNMFGVYIDWSEEFEDRLTKHFINEASWICTDQRVGIAVYQLDGQVVAVSTQTGRKSDEDISFVSTEAFEKVKTFILSLVRNDEDQPNLVTMDQYVDSSWFKGASK